MKYVLSLIVACIVAVVAFGGWYGGIDSSKVEAGFAPLEIASVVIDGTTANIVVGTVEKTTIAENLAAEGRMNRQFETVELLPIYSIGTLARALHEQHILLDLPAGMALDENKSYTAYNRVSASRSTISRTMRYRA